jgi:transcriptional regulator NrdR family protein
MLLVAVEQAVMHLQLQLEVPAVSEEVVQDQLPHLVQQELQTPEVVAVVAFIVVHRCLVHQEDLVFV